ncbi:MAG TPA: TonB-dependent receptor [Rhizomicrobium sp.]|nr:TonB-dependent receptor [Rhizomicrobium sp.]
MLTAVSPALAQQVADNSGVETIIVTAQKRSEDLQKVAVSVQAITTQRLEDLHITDFNDYVKFFPSVTYTSGGAGGGNAAPGFANISMRGIVSGNDGNHSGPLPTVGVYLDEQPITTIGGTLDLHIYDIDRVEVLSGPQGTLYGASSEAGTIRIITNKPDTSAFSAAYDVQGNTVAHGGEGYVAEGYVNVPLADNMAIRVVAWSEHDAGYIDNIPRQRTYPGDMSVGGSVPPITINDYPYAKKDFNSVDTYGARAALKIDLNDSWTIMPSLVFQLENSNGLFAEDPSLGNLKVAQYNPDFLHENWYQAALTVEGKIGDLDLSYSGGHMDWWIHGESDYADYSYWYDKLFPSSFPSYFYNNSNNPIAPTQYIIERDHFIKDSHEIRLASSATDRLRFVGGLFFERQQHWILQNYRINDLATSESVTGWPQTLWLTDQERVDQDMAAFAEVSYDITPQLTLTGGMRLYDYINTLKGFFGFSAGFSSHTGESQCFGPGLFHGAPCTDLDQSAVGTGNTHKVNLTYKIDDKKMVYFTWSTGFRPGGINRRTDDAGPYAPDKLTNYEVGWKTQWFNDTLRINGALFREDWDNVQFPFLGANSFTIIQNAGNATSQGVEADFEWRPISSLTFSGSGAVTDANLTTDYCGFNNPATKQPYTSNCFANDGFPPEAPAGTQLPITPKWKGNLTSRYDFPIAGFAGHIQGSVQAQSSAWDDLRIGGAFPPFAPTPPLVPIRTMLGKQPGWASFDFSAGLDSGDLWSLEVFVQNAFDAKAQQYRYAECVTQVCDSQTYDVPQRPRLIGIKFGQKF